MNEPHDSELHADLTRQMAAFEAARITHPIVLQPARVERILAVVDGSDQDGTVRDLAAAAGELTGATVTEWSSDLDDPVDALLAAAAQHDLLFVPCPFRLDYTTTGAATLSPTLDLLLVRGTTPTCLVRGPVDDPRTCLQRPLVAVDVARHRKIEATALALALARDGGWLALLSVVDPSVGVRKEELTNRYLDPDDLSPENLGGLATARTAALLAELQKHAGEWGVAPRLHARVGSLIDEALGENRRRGALLVAGLDRDPTHTGAQIARSLVLGSALPVLLV